MRFGLTVLLLVLQPAMAAEVPLADQDGRFNDEPSIARIWPLA